MRSVLVVAMFGVMVWGCDSNSNSKPGDATELSGSDSGDETQGQLDSRLDPDVTDSSEPQDVVSPDVNTQDMLGDTDVATLPDQVVSPDVLGDNTEPKDISDVSDDLKDVKDSWDLPDSDPLDSFDGDGWDVVEDVPDLPDTLDSSDTGDGDLDDVGDADGLDGTDTEDVVDPCSIQELWISIYGGESFCPGYTVQENWDATYCEFYLNALGDGYEGHYGIPFSWLEAYLVIGPNDGTVLAAGMMTTFKDTEDGAIHHRYSYGAQIEPNYWKTGFTYQFTGYMGDGSYLYEIQSFAFFIDVQRPNGVVARLWQSNFGANYSWASAFSLPPSTTSIPYGHVDYANDSSEVFGPKSSCK